MQIGSEARKPRILIVCAVDFMACCQLQHHGNGLLEAGFDVHVACADGPYVPRLKERGFTVHRVDLRRTFSPLDHLRALAQLRSLIERGGFDLINTHAPVAGLAGRAAAWLAGARPVVHSVHGFSFHEHMPALPGLGYRFLERALGRITDHLTFVSDEDRRLADSLALGRPGSLRVTLYNGVDPEVFTPRERNAGSAGSRPVIGMTGRMVREKGYPEFLEMARKLAPRFRPLFLVAGENFPTDRDQYGPEFRREVREAGLADSFRFVGHTDDVAACLRAMDLFVLPSRREGFPISILEAMSAALPVVATNIRGCRESVVDGVTGLLVPPRDAAALARAVEWLLLNPGDAARMGGAGRERVRTHFSHRMVAERYVRFIQTVLERSQAGGARRR